LNFAFSTRKEPHIFRCIFMMDRHEVLFQFFWLHMSVRKNFSAQKTQWLWCHVTFINASETV
jgi:hypothetical protein